MLTIEQIRAARALLDWSQSDLADQAGLSQTGIARIENGTNQPNSKTLQKIMSAFDQAGIEFIGESGLRKRRGEMRAFRGRDGFQAFMDDVYKTCTKDEVGDIIVFNVDEKNWIKWMGEDKYKAHSNRMRELNRDIKSRIIVEEGDTFFIASDFAEYRWFPKSLFSPQSFYGYGNKIAFIRFYDDDVQVVVLKEQEFAQGYRVLFDIAWENVAKAPVKAA